MSNITNDQLLELIDETLVWASDVAEMWTGTLHEKIIDVEMRRLAIATDENDLELASELVHHLAQTLEASEAAYQN